MMRYKELAEQCIAQIECGKLKVNTRMPSLRIFNRQHNVSMTTALNCYQHLVSLGWIIAKPQSGYFVAAQSSDNRPAFINFKSKTTDPAKTTINGSYTPAYQEVGPLGVAAFDSTLLPNEKLHNSFRRAMKRQGNSIGLYPAPQGEAILRLSLSEHFRHYDFYLDAQELIITNGCIDAIHSALEITTNEGDAVAISSPCFSGLLELLTQLKRKVVEIPSTSEGIDLAQLEIHMQKGAIKAGLFCTSHMNPHGTSMSALQKQKLVQLAETYHIPIIEDDVYLELAHGKVTPLPAKHWDKKGYILWCGSFSKTIAAGYRLGWCSPGRYFDAYLQRRMYCNQGVSSLTQHALADFINNGDYLKHLKHTRFVVRKNTLDYRAFLSERLPINSKISAPSGGFVLWLQVPNLDSQKLLNLIISQGIDIRIGASFSTLGLYNDCFRLNIGFALTCESVVTKQLHYLLEALPDALGYNEN